MHKNCALQFRALCNTLAQTTRSLLAPSPAPAIAAELLSAFPCIHFARLKPTHASGVHVMLTLVVYDFEVTEQLEFADLMPQLWCSEIDLVVYLGFAPHALDLLNKLGSYKADKDQVRCATGRRSLFFDNVTVLLASGAYQDDLNGKDKYGFHFEAFAMLPTHPGCKQPRNAMASNAPQDDEDTGASAYGYDSYNLLERLAIQRFRVPSSDPIEHPRTGHEFRFAASGELTPADRNRYQADQLFTCSSPGEQP